jgi:hypothetical protein
LGTAASCLALGNPSGAQLGAKSPASLQRKWKIERISSCQITQQGIDLGRQFRLEASIRIDGLAIIQEMTSTAVVYPHQKAEVDEFLNLKIQLEDSK